MARKVTFTGGRELEKALYELAGKEAAKIGRAALRATARPILNEAKANVPVDQGRLKRSLVLKVDRAMENGRRAAAFTATVRVSGRLGYRPRKTDRASTVRGKSGPARYSYQIGSRPDVYGAFIEFGLGVPMQPFMRPAWDAEGGQEALNRMGKEIWAGIEKFTVRTRVG